jgi:phospholipase C
MTDTTKPSHKSYTRRRILAGGAAAATGAWAASSGFGGGGTGAGTVQAPSTESMLPPNVRKMLAEGAPSAQASIGDIKHIVLLMQENRSFDHYFGTMPGVIGFSDPNAVMLPTGRNVFYQPTDLRPEGYLLPFHLDSQTTSAQGLASTAHNWRVQHESWNNGAMNNWLGAHAVWDQPDKLPFVMGYFERQDIPFHWALADAFTICDRYHSSVMGPTAPNRLMWETGSIDPAGTAGGPILGADSGVKTWRTYAQQLTDHGVSWRFYHVPDGMRSATGSFKAFIDAPSTSPLKTNSAQVGVNRFRNDCLNDRLPTVSWLFPGSGQNEHPANSNPTPRANPAAGAKFISDTIDAIAANPAVWAKTVFILVYDENDGLFDHVPPPTPHAGAVGEFVPGKSPSGIDGRGWPVGAGFRVPCIIVSPWTAGGWVCSEPFDHTSCNRFIEAVTGVPTNYISPWRRSRFGNFTSAFRFNDAAAGVPTSLPDAAAALALAQQRVDTLPPPVVPSYQEAPVQEPGQRPSVPE